MKFNKKMVTDDVLSVKEVVSNNETYLDIESKKVDGTKGYFWTINIDGTIQNMPSYYNKKVVNYKFLKGLVK